MDQVVCVRDDWGHPSLKQRPVRGCIYTIRSGEWCRAVRDRPAMLFYRFYEVRNDGFVDRLGAPFEPMFDAEWCRLVKRTSIDVFKDMEIHELVSVMDKVPR